MAKTHELIKTLPLAHTKQGKIVVMHVTEPYGPGSAPVVSIGISLKGSEEEPDWKAHVPYENLADLIAILQDTSKRFRKK